jgi:NADPH:quinone reductase-like Zn-dependent oxidoreductase
MNSPEWLRPFLLIDYKKVQFEEATSDIDVVIDTIGGETRQRSWSVMRPGGILISLVAPVRFQVEFDIRKEG